MSLGMQLTGRMTGNNSRRFPSPRFRHAGNFTLTYTGTTGAATITAASLQYDPSPYRQLLVFIGFETPLGLVCTIGGKRAPVCAHSAGILMAFAAIADAPGDIALTMTISGTGDTTPSIVVYEVEYALPLHQCAATIVSTDSGVSVGSTQAQVPADWGAIFGAYNPNDTGGLTWAGGPVETVDIDAGPYRMGAAELAASSSPQRITVQVTSSFNGTEQCGVSVLPIDFRGVRIVPHGSLIALASADPQNVADDVTISPSLAGYGRGKYLLAIMYESTASIVGVTRNGVAMTLLRDERVSASVGTAFFIQDFHDEVDSSADLSIDWSAAPGANNVAIMRFCVYGNGATPVTAGANNASSLNNATTIDVDKDGALIAAGVRSANTTTVTWTGVDEIVDTTAGNYRCSIAWREFCTAETARAIEALGAGTNAGAFAVLALNP